MDDKTYSATQAMLFEIGRIAATLGENLDLDAFIERASLMDTIATRRYLAAVRKCRELFVETEERAQRYREHVKRAAEATGG